MKTDELDQYKKQECPVYREDCPMMVCAHQKSQEDCKHETRAMHCDEEYCAHCHKQLKGQKSDQPIESWEEKFDEKFGILGLFSSSIEIDITHRCCEEKHSTKIAEKDRVDEVKEYIRSNFVPKQELIKKLEEKKKVMAHIVGAKRVETPYITWDECIEAIEQM